MAYVRVRDQRQTKLDAKSIRCLFLGYSKGTEVYWLICLETKKIVKSLDIVFFEDKTYLEDCSNGRFNRAPTVSVDISPKSNMEELETNGKLLEPDMKERAEANVLAMKSTCNREASKLGAGKKNASKPPPTP